MACPLCSAAVMGTNHTQPPSHFQVQPICRMEIGLQSSTRGLFTSLPDEGLMSHQGFVWVGKGLVGVCTGILVFFSFFLHAPPVCDGCSGRVSECRSSYFIPPEITLSYPHIIRRQCALRFKKKRRRKKRKNMADCFHGFLCSVVLNCSSLWFAGFPII